jgi:hypothetical protein
LVFLLSLSYSSIGLGQEMIQGRVIDGTSERPVSNQKVELLSIGQGMKVERATQTGLDGSFQFAAVEMGQAPHLIIRAIYEGVNYNLSVTIPEGMGTPLTLTVYETTKNSKDIRVSLPVMLVQASEKVLFVQQQYFVNNQTNPKKTLLNPEGTFLFDTPPPEVTHELAVSVAGLGGIPLPQTPTKKPGGGYALSYPMKPGLNEIRVSYRMDSATVQREFNHRLFYATGTSRILILPADLQVSGQGLKAIGRDDKTQAAVYQISNSASRAALRLRITGEAPPVTEPEEGSGDQDSDDSQVKVVRMPNHVYELREFILGGFGVFLAGVLLVVVLQRNRTGSPDMKRGK